MQHNLTLNKLKQVFTFIAHKMLSIKAKTNTILVK